MRPIRLDSEGRVNMNDIHKACGSVPKKRPGLFLTNKKTKSLISNLESTAGIPAVLTYEGQGAVTGTFCHIDVLLAYAAWIDADFYVTVAKTFGNVARGDISRLAAPVFHCCCLYSGSRHEVITTYFLRVSTPS